MKTPALKRGGREVRQGQETAPSPDLLGDDPVLGDRPQIAEQGAEAVHRMSVRLRVLLKGGAAVSRAFDIVRSKPHGHVAWPCVGDAAQAASGSDDRRGGLARAADASLVDRTVSPDPEPGAQAVPFHVIGQLGTRRHVRADSLAETLGLEDCDEDASLRRPWTGCSSVGRTRIERRLAKRHLKARTAPSASSRVSAKLVRTTYKPSSAASAAMDSGFRR